jgi:hypothetical protein
MATRTVPRATTACPWPRHAVVADDSGRADRGEWLDVFCPGCGRSNGNGGRVVVWGSASGSSRASFAHGTAYWWTPTIGRDRDTFTLQRADCLGAPVAADIDHDWAVVSTDPRHHGDDVITLPARYSGFTRLSTEAEGSRARSPECPVVAVFGGAPRRMCRTRDQTPELNVKQLTRICRFHPIQLTALNTGAQHDPDTNADPDTRTDQSQSQLKRSEFAKYIRFGTSRDRFTATSDAAIVFCQVESSGAEFEFGTRRPSHSA